MFRWLLQWTILYTAHLKINFITHCLCNQLSEQEKTHFFQLKIHLFSNNSKSISKCDTTAVWLLMSCSRRSPAADNSLGSLWVWCKQPYRIIMWFLLAFTWFLDYRIKYIQKTSPSPYVLLDFFFTIFSFNSSRAALKHMHIITKADRLHCIQFLNSC